MALAYGNILEMGEITLQGLLILTLVVGLQFTSDMIASAGV